MLRIPLPEDDGFALCTVRGGEGHTHSRLCALHCTRRSQASFACTSLIYRSLVYLGREPVTYRSLPIHCRLRDMLDFRRQSTLR